MPGTEVALAELRKLCPPAFVPQDCLRRAAIKQRIEDRIRTGQAYAFQEEVFNKAAVSLPISATTWGTASLIKSTALTRAGVDALRWWATEIANARAGGDKAAASRRANHRAQQRVNDGRRKDGG